MVQRPIAWVLVALLLATQVAVPASAQGSGASDDSGCGGFDWPCWVMIVLGGAALMFMVAIGRTAYLARRIARGPGADEDLEVPRDLRDPVPPPTEPTGQTVKAVGTTHAPWPDQVRDRAERPLVRPVDDVPSAQVVWGDHRLWFQDGRYFFSLDADPPEDWLPCFSVPKGQRIAVGDDGLPRLERFDPRHPSGQD